jgi:hypothetical protein
MPDLWDANPDNDFKSAVWGDRTGGGRAGSAGRCGRLRLPGQPAHPRGMAVASLDARPCRDGAGAGVVTDTVTGVSASGRGSRPDGATGG